MLSSSNAAFQESQATMDAVRSAILTNNNLSPKIVLDSKEAEIDLDLSKVLKERKADITYVVFECLSIAKLLTGVSPLLDHYLHIFHFAYLSIFTT